MALSETHLIWLDLEMTGLEPEQDVIIEIATLITDQELNVIAEGPVLAIHQSNETLQAMNEWNTKTHGESGLVARVQQSTITTSQAEEMTLAFLSRYVAPQKSPLCGNSIGQDRRFLVRYMPKLEQFFHYRNLDVSTIKELARRWYPESIGKFEKESKHIAMSDIHDSIEELRFYRERLFVK